MEDPLQLSKQPPSDTHTFIRTWLRRRFRSRDRDRPLQPGPTRSNGPIPKCKKQAKQAGNIKEKEGKLTYIFP